MNAVLETWNFAAETDAVRAMRACCGAPGAGRRSSSASVQHTLFDMGKTALDAAPEIARIRPSMPNPHHLLADLSTFGSDNPNHIFVAIDEPHGTIEATVER